MANGWSKRYQIAIAIAIPIVERMAIEKMR